MTLQSLTFTLEQSSAVSSWLNHRLPSQPVSQPRQAKLEAHPALELLLSVLAESLREGVVIVCRNMKPLYMNQRGKELCLTLSPSSPYWAVLPQAISEVCHRLIREKDSRAIPMVAECRTAQAQTIRIRASWLNLPSCDSTPVCPAPQYILVFLQNRDEILQEELQFEQKKYQLTDREMEIWTLLRQEYSYQDIAATLYISVNTVKTHVKNIYAKKRWIEEQDKILVG